MRLSNLLFGLSVLIEGKKQAPEFNHHDLDDIALIAGEEDISYAIEVRNYADVSAFFVVSVNGVSLVTNTAASRMDVEGFVLKPYEKVRLDKFLDDSGQMLSFKYSNTIPFGTIGVAFYVINGGDATLVDGLVKKDELWESELCYKSFEMSALAVLYYIPPVVSGNLFEHYRSSSLPSPFPGDSGKIVGRP